MRFTKSFKTSVTGAALSLLIVGCAAQSEYAALVDEAEQARKKANSVGGEWRDTAKFIKQAKKAAEKADFDKAMKLAKKAKRQGELGYEQAVSQQGTIQVPSYLKPPQ